MTTAKDSDRKLWGRIGALRLHASGGTNTAPARAAFLSKFELEVDPDGVLPIEERQRRAALLRRAHFTELALASARARRRRPVSSTSGPAKAA
jgi:hypothetical protein